jgi:hypothetical protein
LRPIEEYRFVWLRWALIVVTLLIALFDSTPVYAAASLPQTPDFTLLRTVTDRYSTRRTRSPGQMRLDAGIRCYRYFWKYIFLGMAIIFGFWLTWYPLFIILMVIDLFVTGALGGGVPLHDIHVLWRYTSYLVSVGVTVAIPILIWAGATKATVADGAFLKSKVGATVYALAATIILCAAGEFAHVMSWFNSLDSQDSHDPRRTSTNAATRLERHSSLPLIGFWQTTCDPNGPGITIERETRWLTLYRFDFCSVHGCGLRSYSKIVSDPEFRVIDLNTIEFEPSAVQRYRTIYHRCG